MSPCIILILTTIRPVSLLTHTSFYFSQNSYHPSLVLSPIIALSLTLMDTNVTFCLSIYVVLGLIYMCFLCVPYSVKSITVNSFLLHPPLTHFTQIPCVLAVSYFALFFSNSLTH